MSREYLWSGPRIGRVGQGPVFIAANAVWSGSEGVAEGGCGGNSAAPERWEPRRLLVQSKAKQNTLFLLEEFLVARANRKS